MPCSSVRANASSRSSRCRRIDTRHSSSVLVLRSTRPIANGEAENSLRSRTTLGRDIDQQRIALTAAGADRCETETASISPQLVDHRAEDAGARGPDRMAECDGAAVDVDLLGIGVEQLRAVEDDRGKRLVQLHAFDILDRLAGLRER